MPGKVRRSAVQRAADDESIMRLRSQGLSQVETGQRLGLTQQQVSEGEQRMRAKVRAPDLEQLRIDMTEQLNRMRAAAEDIMNMPGAPVVKAVGGSDGEAGRLVTVRDPEHRDADGNPVVVRDHGARLDAMREIVRAQQRMSQLLGVDQPVKVEQSGTMRVEVVGVDPAELE